MRRPVDPEAAVAYGLFSRHQAREAGYSRAGIELRVRRGEWVSTERGLLRTADHADQPGDRLLLAVLRAGPSAVASHLSAAAALGWELFEEPDVPEVVVPRTHGTVEVAGARLRRQNLSISDVSVIGVLPVTTAALTLIDVAATRPTVDAVVAIDSALRSGQVTERVLRAELRGRRTMPRCRTVATLLDLVEPTSGSVPETLARLLFRDAGMPTPVGQFEVLADGRLLGRVDFAWPEYQLLVEIDGFAWHSGRDAWQRDLTRQNGLTLAGWTVLRFTADDVRHRPDYVTETVARALAGRSRVEHN